MTIRSVGRIIALTFLPVCFALSAFAEARVKLTFSPESEKFAEATNEYRKIWDKDGEKIIKTIERISGTKLRMSEIKVIVYEGVSRSGFLSRPMRMRASYSPDVKKGTLIHELGHRLTYAFETSRRVDGHRVLFLFLYDVWEELYGETFAQKLVKVESGRRGLYDYEAAWKWAVSMSKEARKTKLAEIRTTTVVKKAFEKFNNAFLKADSTILEDLLAEDYIHTNGSGSVLNKKEWLGYIRKRKAELDSGKLKVDSYGVKNLRIKIYGFAAVVTGTVFTKGTRGSNSFDRSIHITNVWVKRDGRWRRTAFHDSRVPK